jgi:hypothetical protein
LSVAFTQIFLLRTTSIIVQCFYAGRAPQVVWNQSKQGIGLVLNQTEQGSQFNCEECPLGHYQNRSDSKAESCDPCPKGTFVNQTGALVCQLCPSGTCQNMLASNSCNACPWWDNVCGGSVCSLELLTNSIAEIVVIIQFPTSKSIFLSAQEPVLDALSLLLNVRRSQVRVSDVREYLVDRRFSSGVKATMDIVVSSANCSVAKSLLTESNVNRTMKASGLPGITSMSASFRGCDAQSNLSVQADTLSIELKQQITSTTVVVASVVSVVVAGSVAGAVAGSLGVAISSSGALPGASVYQLIDSVQFLNIYGSMFKSAVGNSTVKRTRRAYTDEPQAYSNVTSSTAADFR